MYRNIAQVCGERRSHGIPSHACRRPMKPIIAQPHPRLLAETEGQVRGQRADDGRLQRRAGGMHIQ